MKVLVTGNRGFVGAAVERLLLARGHKVVGFDILDGCDIRDKEMLKATMREHRPDRILHLCAIARFADAEKDPVEAFEVNTNGARNVSFISRECHTPVVYASTGSVYMPIKREPPITEDFAVAGNSIYGCSKLVGEQYIQRTHAPWIILRLGHLYGAEKRGHGLIGGFLDAIRTGRKPKLFGGDQTNDFMYIDDVAVACLLALESSADKWKQIYNIGTGVETSARDAGQMVCDAFGYTGDIDVVPQRNVDPDRFVFDVTKAKHMLGFSARVGLREGLEKMRGVMTSTDASHG